MMKRILIATLLLATLTSPAWALCRLKLVLGPDGRSYTCTVCDDGASVCVPTFGR